MRLMVLRTRFEAFVAGASAEYHLCFALATKNSGPNTPFLGVFYFRSFSTGGSA